MKVTKTQLKKIIMEEYQKLQEGDDVSRMIGDVEKIGDEISRVSQMVADAAVAERLEHIESMVSSLFERMHDLLPSMRE
tara:strand:- start:364 stop:600 length:237 start_codon:yes stop_codon:yes gene_type:complete